jgi:hypothetical protein
MPKKPSREQRQSKGPSTFRLDSITRQAEYVNNQKRQSHGFGVVFAEAFIRGMRDLGYKDPAWAMAEMIDNSFQAGATTVSIRLAHLKSVEKPKGAVIAICDNGIGMIPEMLGYAVRWGGTDRWDDRDGFGRYGYGLPSAAIFLARRYTVYSKADNAPWNSVTVDLEKIAAVATDPAKIDLLLSPRTAKLPPWLTKEESEIPLLGLQSGTVILLEEPDRRLKGWIQADSIIGKLRQELGVIYRHWIPNNRIFVQGEQVQAVDPLFLMEHSRLYDETPVKAQPVEARTFQVDRPEGRVARVTIRASVLPPNFQLANPEDYGLKGAEQNRRSKIMRDYNGILICRANRQIDTIRPNWTKFQNFDANIKIEINFDPELDEEFGITTSKQQIVIDDDMWNRLRGSGTGGGDLDKLIDGLRKKFRDMRNDLKTRSSPADKKQSSKSIKAMELSSRYKGTVTEPTQEQKEEANRNLIEAAREQSLLSGRPISEIIDEIKEKTSNSPWDITFVNSPEGPFYRPTRLGEQKQLRINTEHPFFTQLWSAAGDLQPAIELLILVLAERELESRGELERTYRAERAHWSERLRNALDELGTEDSDLDDANK